MNTEFTTRGVNDLEDTQEVALGSYQDAAPIVTSSVNSQVMQSPYTGFNLETFDLSEILNREYPINTFSWTTAQTANTTIGTQDYPSALFSQPFIADKIKNFRGFRGGIRITARVTSANVNYGMIMMAFVPNPTADAYYGGRISNLDRLSGFPHVLISAAQSNTAVLDIPFIYNQRFLDLRNYVGSGMGRIIFRVLNPLTNVFGDVTDVEIFTTAQFVEAEVMIPFSPQSNPRRSKAAAVQSAKSRTIKRPNHEAYQKSSEGVISGTLEAMDDIVGTLSTVPFVAPLAGLYDAFSKPVQGLLKIAGLDKPTSLARTDVVKYNPYSDIANARGVDTCAKLSVDPENGITTQPVVGGVTHDEMDLTYIASCPTFMNTFAFSAVSPIGSQFEIFTTDLKAAETSFPHFLVGLAQWWSGSPKIKIYIAASNFHSVRIAFYYSNANTSWQNCYHRIVDIQGDTEVEMTLPYSHSYAAAGSMVEPMRLYATLLSYSQADPSISSPVYMNVYFAMASDFRLYGPTNIMLNSTFIPQSNPRLDFQRDFEGIHPSIVGYKQENMICGEEITSYRDLVHRYTTIRRLVNNVEFSRYEGRGNGTSTGFVGLEKLGLIFRFHRGSCRFKMIQRDNAYRGIVHYQAGTYVSGDGPLFEGTTFSSMINPVLEFEMPYYSNYLFEENGDNSPHKGIVAGPSQNAQDRVLMMKAGGDDFSFHFLCSAPPYDFPSVVGYGNEAIVTFLQEQLPFKVLADIADTPLPVEVITPV